MKKVIFLFITFLFTSPLLASELEWSDVEISHTYSLKQDVVLENGVTFKSGDKFEVDDIIIGEIPVIFFDMRAKDCRDESQTGPMTLVDFKDVVIGVSLQEGCHLGFYIEPRDYYSEAIFGSGPS